MSLLLLFNGGVFQIGAPMTPGVADFSLIAAATIDGLGGMPDIADVAGATPCTIGGRGITRIR